MGVGTPDDIVEAVRRGIDMFDCVHADARRPPRPGLHPLRPPQPAQRPHAEDTEPARSGSRSARPSNTYSPRLSAPPRPLERDPGHDAADLEQPGLLPGADGRPAQGHRRGPARGLSSARSRKAGPRASATARRKSATTPTTSPWSPRGRAASSRRWLRRRISPADRASRSPDSRGDWARLGSAPWQPKLRN